MDGKSNINELSKQLYFTTKQNIPTAQTKKTDATSATAQFTASTSDGNKASKSSSAIFSEASKKLPSSSLKLGWSYKNPVTIINSKVEFVSVANKMLAQFEKSNPYDMKLKELNILKAKALSTNKYRDFDLPPTALDAAKIIEPLISIINSGSEIDSDNDIEEGLAYNIEEGLAYNIDEKPVGIAWCMVLDSDHTEEKEYNIERLVADPWTRGAGTTLIEAAVNRSEEHGFKGKVVLMPANDEVRAHYERLGFVSDGRLFDVVLDPEASDKWSKNDDGEYYYAYKPDDQKGSDDAKPIYFTSLDSLKT